MELTDREEFKNEILKPILVIILLHIHWIAVLSFMPISSSKFTGTYPQLLPSAHEAQWSQTLLHASLPSHPTPPSFSTQNRAYDAVIVLKQKISSPRRHHQFMDALTDFGVFDRQKFCPDPLVTGDPGLTAIVGPKDACR